MKGGHEGSGKMRTEFEKARRKSDIEGKGIGQDGRMGWGGGGEGREEEKKVRRRSQVKDKGMRDR